LQQQKPPKSDERTNDNEKQRPFGIDRFCLKANVTESKTIGDEANENKNEKVTIGPHEVTSTK
jgi:hypothetical protein